MLRTTSRIRRREEKMGKGDGSEPDFCKRGLKWNEGTTIHIPLGP